MENEFEDYPPCINHVQYDFEKAVHYIANDIKFLKKLKLDLDSIKTSAKIAPNYIEYLKNKQLDLFENTPMFLKQIWIKKIEKKEDEAKRIISLYNDEINIKLNEIIYPKEKQLFYDKMWEDTEQYVYNHLLSFHIDRLIDDYNKELLKKENNQNDEIINSYSGIINELKGHVKDVTDADIIYIIENKCLPEGKEKIIWHGSKADAFRFAYIFELRNCELNNCFVPKSGKLFVSSDKPKLKSEVKEVNEKKGKIYNSNISFMENEKSLYGKIKKYKKNPTLNIE